MRKGRSTPFRESSKNTRATIVQMVKRILTTRSKVYGSRRGYSVGSIIGQKVVFDIILERKISNNFAVVKKTMLISENFCNFAP